MSDLALPPGYLFTGPAGKPHGGESGPAGGRMPVHRDRPPLGRRRASLARMKRREIRGDSILLRPGAPMRRRFPGFRFAPSGLPSTSRRPSAPSRRSPLAGEPDLPEPPEHHFRGDRRLPGAGAERPRARRARPPHGPSVHGRPPPPAVRSRFRVRHRPRRGSPAPGRAARPRSRAARRSRGRPAASRRSPFS